jgi:hypothetical protein
VLRGHRHGGHRFDHTVSQVSDIAASELELEEAFACFGALFGAVYLAVVAQYIGNRAQQQSQRENVVEERHSELTIDLKAFSCRSMIFDLVFLLEL